MRDERILNAYLAFAARWLRVGEQAATATDVIEIELHYGQQRDMNQEGVRLWRACLENGWTEEDVEAAQRR